MMQSTDNPQYLLNCKSAIETIYLQKKNAIRHNAAIQISNNSGLKK